MCSKQIQSLNASVQFPERYLFLIIAEGEVYGSSRIVGEASTDQVGSKRVGEVISNSMYELNCQQGMAQVIKPRTGNYPLQQSWPSMSSTHPLPQFDG